VTQSTPQVTLSGTEAPQSLALDRGIQPLVVDIETGAVAFTNGEQTGLDALNTVEQRLARLARVDGILHPVAPDDFTGLTPEQVAEHEKAAESILNPAFPTPRNAAEADAMARALAAIRPVPPSQ
jgi:hypothetical protein